MAFSPDGRRLVVSYTAAIVRVWDVLDQKELGEPLRVPAGRYRSLWVAYRPDGKAFVTSGRDVRIWDTASESQLGPPLGRGGGAVTFSPDGRTIAAGGSDGKIRLWDSRTRTPLGRPFVLGGDDIARVVFTPNGKIIAASGVVGPTKLWDSQTQRQLPLPAKEAETDSAVFSPNGRILAGIGVGEIRLWDRLRRRQIMAPHDRWAWRIAFSPNGQILAAGGLDGVLRLWNLHTGREIGSPLESYPDAFDTVAFSPDGHTISAGTSDGDVWLWDLQATNPVGVRLEMTNADAARKTCASPAGCGADYITSLAFSGDGATVTAINDWPSLTTWNVHTRQQLGETEDLGIGENGFAVIASSSDGERTAEAEVSADGFVAATTDLSWQGATRGKGRAFDATYSLALNGDGEILAAGGYELWDWNTLTGQPVGTFWDDPARIYRRFDSLAFSPINTLAAGGTDGTVSFWDPWTHKQLGPPLQASPYGSIESVAYSPDGKLLATASDDWTIRLWDSQTHTEIGPPLDDSGPVKSIAFSPDGRALASASLAAVRIWDTTNQTEIGNALPLPGE
jgi:WD40 repeat protein